MPVANNVNLVELSHPLGRHVGVFGAGGKSTLARAIARKHGLEFIELDAIRHMPGWQLRPEEEVKRIATERMDSNPRGWVTDHNFKFIYERTESVIVLELPFRTIFWRNLKRSLRRAWTKELVCGGNTETFRQHFTSGESMILETWKRRKRYSRIGEVVAGQILAGVDMFYIRTPRELDQFYEVQNLTRNLPQIIDP